MNADRTLLNKTNSIRILANYGEDCRTLAIEQKRTISNIIGASAVVATAATLGRLATYGAHGKPTTEN
jgi:hypothetical protein